MKLPRLVKQIGKRVVQAMPILRRHILTSTDYELLSGENKLARPRHPRRAGLLHARSRARNAPIAT